MPGEQRNFTDAFTGIQNINTPFQPIRVGQQNCQRPAGHNIHAITLISLVEEDLILRQGDDFKVCGKFLLHRIVHALRAEKKYCKKCLTLFWLASMSINTSKKMNGLVEGFVQALISAGVPGLLLLPGI